MKRNNPARQYFILFEVQNSSSYLFSILIQGVELKELILLLVIVVGANEHDNEDCEEDRETLNPS